MNVSEERKNKYAELYFDLLVSTNGGSELQPWFESFENASSIEEKLVLIHPDFWGCGLDLTRIDRAKHHPLGTRGNRDFATIKKRETCSTEDCQFKSIFD